MKNKINLKSYRLLYVPPGLNSKILHADYISFMCSVWLSEETERFALHAFSRLVFTTEVESVYCAVRTESLYNIRFVLKGLISTYVKF